METAIAKLGLGIYTASDVAKILRIPYSKSRYWFKYYAQNKLLESIGYKYYFDINDSPAIDFLTLIEMYVFYALKDEAKMTTNNIIKFHKILSGDLKTPYPFANCQIYASRKNMFYEFHNIIKDASDLPQTFITDFIIPFYKKISFNEDNLAHKFHPLGKEKSIIIDPEHQFGKPVIEGTNIVTETLYDYYLGGDSIDFISRLYNIKPENVKDAISFSKAA
jgi:uncharacterized protein (DUF433 family)